MRRVVVAAFLTLFVLQSSGAAVASSLGPINWPAGLWSSLLAPFVGGIDGAQRGSAALGQAKTLAVSGGLVARAGTAGPAPLIRHTPLPVRPAHDYADRQRFARPIPKANPVAKEVRVARPIDLTKLRHVHAFGRTKLLGLSPIVQRYELKRGGLRRGTPGASLPAPVTGILPWWTYQPRAIPGMGVAMVNVVNLNFLMLENDVDVPDGELDLSFRRVYNSQSGHTAQNDDGSTPSVFGNRWTNNLDVHLASSGAGNTRTISLYTGDGARDDYTCDITQQAVCQSNTPGVYDLLAPTQITNGIACQFQWTKKSGASYMFDAPYPDCTSNGAGYYGRLLEVLGRNQKFYITLTYSWNNNDDTNPENIAKIVVAHQPDGAQLTLTFSSISSSITELTSISTPDGATVDYQYTTDGFLADVDKPGNMPVLPKGENLPTKFLDGNPILTKGNLPETYFIEQPGVVEACGPRAAISIIDTNQQPTDGACVDFDYDTNTRQLSDWYTRGVLNPTPDDGEVSAPIQSGPSTGFVQWNDTQFFSDMTGNGCPTTASMDDALGHYVIWCYDASGRTFETSAAVNYYGSTTTWLTTSQTWDANNDLTSTTDARGNETDIAYDSNGNVAEVALPKQSTLQNGQTQTIRPTYFLDHDQYNNLTNFCDPANNASNGWIANPGETPCAASGTTNYTKLRYTSDGNEPYGCLTDTYTPSGYRRSVSYSNSNCGNGLPNQIQAFKSYTEDDGTVRQPTQTFSYSNNPGLNNGLLATYQPGGPDNATWQIQYTSNGANRVRSVQDPDGVTSYSCYNVDGSVFYSESAKQNSLDSGPGCPAETQFNNGTATPPPYATAYGSDADGDSVTVMYHHNCPDANGNCTANNTAGKQCNSQTTLLGMTCNFYDGLDRLVEVRLPYDSSFDIYQKHWITRYLYDLTGGEHVFRGAPQFLAYGNLFKVMELLPSNPTVQETPVPKSVSNSSYAEVKAVAYDGLDRPIIKYAGTGGTTGSDYTTETLTWDTSMIPGASVAGYLGSDCNSATPSQCQEFDYYPDGEEMTFESSDNSSKQRGYSYDPDGRPTQITRPNSQPQTYAYDVDGDLGSSTDVSDPGGGQASQATLTYNRYADGSQESLDVAASTLLNQKTLFDYSYRNDGPLQTEVIDDANVGQVANSGKTTLRYGYTDAGRLTSRGETGAGAYPSPTPQTTISYSSNPPTGLVTDEVTPVTELSGFKRSAEGEVTSVTSTAGGSSCPGPYIFAYTLRGEVAGRPGCPGTQSVGTLYANGVALPSANSFFGTAATLYTWNDLMGVLTASSSCTPSSTACTSSWVYDGAGRMTSQTAPYPMFTSSPTETTATRTYDAENHLQQTTLKTTNAPYEQVEWGPDGHPFIIAGAPKGGSSALYQERLHWAGDQLLFTTNNGSGATTLDDIKVDTQGDILPGSQSAQGYNGLTFYDRGPGGAPMGCHNINGTTFSGVVDGFLGLGGNECASAPSQGPKMPTSLNWNGSAYRCPFTVGSGGTLGMPRPDGFADGCDIVQGVRSYDPTAGAWTTPDTYAGSISDPTSLNSYLWNGNNPVANMDPSGYISSIYIPQLPNFGPDPTNLLWNAYLSLLSNGGLQTIAWVVAHGRPRSVTFSATGLDPFAGATIQLSFDLGRCHRWALSGGPAGGFAPGISGAVMFDYFTPYTGPNDQEPARLQMGLFVWAVPAVSQSWGSNGVTQSIGAASDPAGGAFVTTTLLSGQVGGSCR